MEVKAEEKVESPQAVVELPKPEGVEGVKPDTPVVKVETPAVEGKQPVDLEAENQRLKAELAALNKTHMAVKAERDNLVRTGVDVSNLGQRVEGLETLIAENRAEQVNLQILGLIDRGDEEQAGTIATREFKRTLTSIGMTDQDIAADPDLRKRLAVSDPVEALRNLRTMEPLLLKQFKPAVVTAAQLLNPTPAPQEPPSDNPGGEAPKGETSEEMEVRIRREVEEKYGVHKMVTQPPTGGAGSTAETPDEVLKEGFRRLNK